ncbi:MAG: hypothetical protein NT121_13705 [Chloroflexi bacterium]|nr:hypothetical protein [Chloroflexota bacterium]
MSAKRSQRFNPSALTEKLVPVILVVILLGLLAVFVMTGLAMLGITPGA